jgi:hypothetical protein
MKRLSIIALVCMVFATGCNWTTKEFGGTKTLTLDPGQKVIDAFPEDADIWILTRPMKATDTAETYKLVEKSNLGVAQGTFIIVESK